ncbi:MAG: hypothetical protein K0S20_436, partial [Patescibacteria group bacterium]|nr:hypothetical protein [Patescibacteria group bacterium]
GATTYSVAIDPELSFTIEGVNSGQTHNGITTDITTTPTAFPFGTLVTDQPHHAAHKLTITTNAPHGYKVFSYLADPITGSYGSTEISPFGATNATWNTPQAWMAPTGTVAGSNTGWFGANTTDVRIPGWSSAANKFGPISTVPHIVAESSGPDPSGSIIYVTYVLGVNGVQTSDIYIGNLLYDIQPTY